MRLLLVEDDVRVAEPLAVALTRRGFQVSMARTGAEALAAARSDNSYHLVLLDLGLPDRDGLDVCRELRSGSDVAIITLTARSDERDKVLGLRAGADDYVVKPFGIAELTARIEAVLRRVRPQRHEPLAVGQLTVDLDRHVVTRAGREVSLTRKEFELLTVLARDAGKVFSREELFLRVWQTHWRGSGRTLDVHVSSIRAKLGEPWVVETVRGVGYRIVAEACG